MILERKIVLLGSAVSLAVCGLLGKLDNQVQAGPGATDTPVNPNAGVVHFPVIKNGDVPTATLVVPPTERPTVTVTPSRIPPLVIQN